MPGRSLLAALLLAALAAAPLAGRQAAPAPAAPTHDAVSPAPPAARRPLVIAAEVDGIIHPITAEFMSEVIDEADTSGAALVVFTLRTPGGLLDSTQSIVSRMITSRAPVVVFVGPSGARAASAGFILVLASDIAVMAPGTHIGAAHPVSGSGAPMDETMKQKVESDAAAYVRSLADARHRNVALAAEAVTASRAFTEHEALHAQPPLIDFVAPNVWEIVKRLDGKTVARFDGRTTVVRTTGAEMRERHMSWRQTFLSALAHPQVAYLLITLGMLGLTVELWHPGAILPGVAGGLCLLLGFFAFQVLPVNTTGLLLIVFGIGLLALEIKVPSFGALGVGGTISLVIGSIMLTREVPGVDVSLALVIPMSLFVAGLLLFLGRLAYSAQRLRPVTGAEGLVGREARVVTGIEPGSDGRVSVHGELWRARSPEPIAAGTTAIVRAVDGLTLMVEPAGPSVGQGEAS